MALQVAPTATSLPRCLRWPRRVEHRLPPCPQRRRRPSQLPPRSGRQLRSMLRQVPPQAPPQAVEAAAAATVAAPARRQAGAAAVPWRHRRARLHASRAASRSRCRAPRGVPSRRARTPSRHRATASTPTVAACNTYGCSPCSRTSPSRSTTIWLASRATSSWLVATSRSLPPSKPRGPSTCSISHAATWPSTAASGSSSR